LPNGCGPTARYLRRPDEKQVEALAGKLKAKGVVSVAICFLN
jgi:N-methylhydantoinase A/oxoprolinase/acetone carboxylase beta subunit